MINEPRKIVISNFGPKEVELANHPTKDLGKRIVRVDGNILISGSDAEELKEGEIVRLLGLGIVKIKNLQNEIHSEFVDESMEAEKKIQWIAESDAVQIKIIIPNQLFNGEKFNEKSLITVDAVTESAYLGLKDDVEIQFVRLGYYRKESAHQVIFTHK